MKHWMMFSFGKTAGVRIYTYEFLGNEDPAKTNDQINCGPDIEKAENQTMFITNVNKNDQQRVKKVLGMLSAQSRGKSEFTVKVNFPAKKQKVQTGINFVEKN